jgi:hypothetical protein
MLTKKAKGKTKAAQSPRRQATTRERPPPEKPAKARVRHSSPCADRERRGQTEAVRPVSTVGKSHRCPAACATCSAGGSVSAS